MRRGRPPHPELLTPREQEVLSLLREGLTNPQIAERLGISLPGARYHVSEILSKLGVSSRQEAAEISSAGATSRPRWAYGLLAAPLQKLASLGVAKGIAASALLVAGAGVLLLALGVFAMNHRDNGGAPAQCDLADETDACQLGKVAYVQNGDVWVKQLPNGTPQRLTTTGDALSPRWSQSGRWLLLEKNAADDAGTWVMYRDGSRARKLDATTGDAIWSPTEDLLAYVDDNGDLSAAAPDGSNQRTLVQHAVLRGVSDEALANPLWSPDGATLAFSSWTRSESYSGLWSVGVASGDARELVGDRTQPGINQGPSGPMQPVEWSPDGNQLYFWRAPVFSASIEADGVALWSVSSAGSDAQKLGIDSLLYPDYIDAAASALVVANGGNRMSWTSKAISTVWSDGSVHSISPPGEAAIEPVLSRDGIQIAYVTAPDKPDVTGGDPSFAAMAQRRIWLTSIDGTGLRRLTSGDAYREEAPQWSHDGSSILFVRVDGENQASLWYAPTAGGTPVKLTMVSIAPPLPAPSAAPYAQPDVHFWGYYGHYDWSQMFDWWQP